MTAEIYHTLALTKIQRLRRLPNQSELLVKVGQKVSASEKIADSYPENKYQIINVKKLLNFNNSQDARRAIELEVGRKLKSGDLIAQSQGVFSKSIKAEQDSEVILINGSLVLLKQNQIPQPILAGFESFVSEIMPNYGVILETNGVLVQGTWGNQRVGSGILVNIMQQPEEEFSAKQIDVNHRGSILMGGYCRNSNLLKAAKDFNIRGLILSSINPDLLPLALEMEYPIVIIEGFSPLPMNMRAFELLKSNEKREISLNSIYDVKRKEKPEIIITLNAEAAAPNEAIELREGLVVRVNEGLFQGKAGMIKRIVNNSVTLFNGVRTTCAIIQFNNEEQISIPLANLDILE